MNARFKGRSVSDSLLVVDGLVKRFGALTAVNEVSFDMKGGDCLGIIGPNGSGKTTLFNTITGFQRPSAGSVSWRGEDITGHRPDRLVGRGLVRTFQGVMTFSSESALQNVRIASERRRRNGATSLPTNPEEILEYCGLLEYRDVTAADLPYGVGRTLGIAMTMAVAPDLIMLDEPASGLNDSESADLSTLLQRIHQTGCTLAIIDHDMAFLMPIVDRLVVLDAGSKLTEGTPVEVRGDQRVVDAYLGTGVLKASVHERSATATPRPPSTTPALEVRDVRSGYGAADVLQNVSITVATGEAVAVLGANGAGKTTLMRTICAVLPLRSGEITFGDVEITATAQAADLDPVRRRLRKWTSRRAQTLQLHKHGVVMVPEGRHIFPAISVKDNLLVAGRRGDDEARDRMDWILTIFPALQPKLNDAGGSLSGGQQQMLAIGRGLMARPRLLCLDEPSLGLSPLLMEQLTEQISKLHQETDMSLLIVEQSMTMALALTDRAYVLRHGHVVHSGKSSEMSVSDLAEAYLS